MKNEKEEFILIKTLRGEVVPVPKKKQLDYEKQGCEILGDYENVQAELEEVLMEEVTPEPEQVVEEPVVEEPVVEKPRYDFKRFTK